jgi:hypothetical protein
MALQQEDPETAIEELESARPYERGHLWTIYLRGEAHLAADQPSKAMAEFQKLQDLRSVQPDLPVHTLAHLGVARASAAAGDRVSGARPLDNHYPICTDSQSSGWYRNWDRSFPQVDKDNRCDRLA